MAIRDWPVTERPREKLLALGSGSLSDAELLAVILGNGTRGRDALELSRELLIRHGGLRGLFGASVTELCAMRGLGQATYTQFQAILEMFKRHLGEPLLRGQSLESPESARDWLSSQLRDHPYEVFACLWLDNRHRIISFDEVFRGTINGASVYPREIVRIAIRHNAAAVILAHNHPSGIAEPSQADRIITGQLKTALELIETRVLDHIVIGDNQSVSFAQRGLL